MARINTGTGFLYNNRVFLLTLLLTAIAAIPRLYHLGELGFYMDEETTAFASRAIAEGKYPQMPSGMPYHRALPQSYLNAMSARVFGLDNEFSYRLPAAIFGILTVPLIFLLARPYTGTSVACLAALLLAFSEWHILTSRQARMYAPFLFFYIACAFSLLRWARSDSNRYLFISITLFIFTVSFHQLGVFAAFIPLVALFIQGFSMTPAYKLVLFSAISGISAYFYGSTFVSAPYRAWKISNGIETIDTVTPGATTGLHVPELLILVPALTGALLGVWLARQLVFADTEIGMHFRRLARYTLAILFGGLAATANINGAFLAGLLLLALYPGTLTDFLRLTWKPLLAITAVASLSAGVVVMNSGLLPGLKSMFRFPFQYWTLLGELTPGITILFLAALAYLAYKGRQAAGQHVFIMVICALFPLILVGIVKNWVPARYIIMAYPFILIVASLFLYVTVKYVLALLHKPSATPVMVFSILVVISGIPGGHGLFDAYKVATLGYGDNANRIALIFPVYPDHKHPGKYVARHSNSDDLILAEDILQQQWYAEKVDYWLRNHHSHMSYLYKDSDQRMRDIYVNSIAATAEILADLETETSTKIWLITSAESHHERKYYLSDAQLAWLESIEESHTPVFTGMDGISRVYCLHCPDNH